MVGEGNSVFGERPCVVPLEFFFINQDTDQFRNAKRWMRIVNMDADALREFIPFIRSVARFVVADNIFNSGSDQKIFLAQAELSSHTVAVVRIKDAGHGIDLAALSHSSCIVSTVEGFHIDGLAHWLRIQKMEYADILSAFA